MPLVRSQAAWLDQAWITACETGSMTVPGPSWKWWSSDVPARLGLGAPALARPEGVSAFSNPWPSQSQCRGPGSGLARLQAMAFSKPSTIVKPRLGNPALPVYYVASTR